MIEVKTTKIKFRHLAIRAQNCSRNRVHKILRTTVYDRREHANIDLWFFWSQTVTMDSKRREITKKWGVKILPQTNNLSRLAPEGKK